MRILPPVLCGLVCLLQASLGWAQSDSLAASRPRGEETPVSVTLDALPGVHRIGVPGVDGPRLSGAASVGYGYTEAQAGETDAHHRLASSLAVGGTILPFLQLALRVDVRHDRHGEDEHGPDDGTLVDTGAIVRLGTVLGRGFHIGAESRVSLPGAARTEQGYTASFDNRALAAYSGLPGWVFAAMGGYRLGHSGAILEEATRMRVGDRMALGLSQFDAVLLGLGSTAQVGKSEVFGEVTWDVLIGNGAPSASQSPLRTTLGVRHPLNDWFRVQGLAEVSPLARAASAPGDPLVPIEPRLTVQLGAMVSFDTLTRQPVALPPVRPAEAEETPPAVEPTPAEPEAAPTAALRVVLVDQKGHPISDAQVTVTTPGVSDDTSKRWVLPLTEVNVYERSDLPAGELELVVRADLLKEHSQNISLSAEELAEEKITLLPAATMGSQLRGVVRAYTGAGIPATITIEPKGKTVRCNPAGEFEVDLEPGIYQVRIEAEGYRTQRRNLRVREEGVTVLNADLQKTR